MTTLLVLREQIKKIYARYGGYIIRVLRFLLALAVFLTANMTIGYMERIKYIWIPFVLAAVCAFLPCPGLQTTMISFPAES